MEKALQLLKKYWEGKATSADKQWLFDFFKIDDERLLHQLYERYLDDIDTTTSVLTEDQSAVLLQKIQLRINPDSKTQSAKVVKLVPRWLKWTAAAAVFVACLSVFILHINRRDQAAPEQQIAQRVFKNTGSLADTITLPDRSVVILSPGGEITLNDSFNINTRDLLLTGKAHFAVAKDKARPFTVTANEIATTALGTAFTIDATPVNISVELHEGKVLLRSAIAGILFDQLYLKPGERLEADLTRKTYAVKIDKINTDRGSIVVKASSKTKARLFKGFSFKKESLSGILDQLSAHFEQPVIYQKEELKGKLFTGSFPPDDKLENILAVIASLNDLQVKKQGRGFIITTNP